MIANLAAPRLADVVGWHNVLGLAMLPLALVLVVFTALAQDARRAAAKAASPVRLLSSRDLWWFCLFYSVTFGGYVGLSSFLPLFWRDQYAVDPATAGMLTAAGAFVGSGIRPIGGYLADRVGGVRSLSVLLVCIAMVYGAASQLPVLNGMGLLIILGMACLGLGNGAIFQLVPQRFQGQIGAATGMVGAVGGLGGFMLPILLGGMKEGAGSFGTGFAVLAVIAFAAFLSLRVLVARQDGWRISWNRGLAPVRIVLDH